MERRKWDAAIADEIKPVAGMRQTVAVSQLMQQCGMGGGRWSHQCAMGFPITGELSHRGVGGVGKKRPSFLPLARLCASPPCTLQRTRS